MSGNDEERAQRATYGGAGWQLRSESHRDDVRVGTLWSSCGVTSEVAPLRQVLLAAPGEWSSPEGPPDAWLMLDRPVVSELVAQAEGIAAAYEAHGVEVVWARPSSQPPPNYLFQRDLFFMTGEGAILSRPAHPVRAAEARATAEVLARRGVPILLTPRGDALLEGADLLWLSEDEVLVGLGVRTNQAAFEQVSTLFADLGVRATATGVPSGVQHLLGVVNLVSDELAVVDAARVGDSLVALLAARGFEVVSLPPSEELAWGLGMNFVTLSPGVVLMPAGCPEVRAQLEAAGIRTVETDIGEYRKAAGGIGCLTGILARGSA